MRHASVAHIKNTITINGKVYDAHTGALVTDVVVSAPPAASLDSTQVKTVAKRAIKHHNIVGSVDLHSRQHHAHTLKRELVKKPYLGAKPHRVAGALDSRSRSIDDARTLPVSERRLARAKATAKHTLVSRFGSSHAPIVKRHAAIDVHPVPKTTAPASKIKSTNHRAAQHKSDKDLLIDAALLKAISHEQHFSHPHRRHRVAKKTGLSPRFVSFAASAAVFLLLAGFFTYQNLPHLAMRLADSRAGISAKLPGYHPSGYALNGAINYSPGQVSYRFQTRDNRSFSVTQTASNWSSETLEKGFVATTNQPTQRTQAAGRIVYIYGSNNATWVDGGIWYKVEGDTALSSEQLLKIAASF